MFIIMFTIYDYIIQLIMDKKKINKVDELNIIAKQIENLDDVSDYQNIFDILMNDKSGNLVCSFNKNGVFINLSAAEESTITKVKNILNKTKTKKNNNKSLIQIDNKIEKERAHKLSNYEQNLLKHREIKKAQDDETKYEELSFSSNKKTKK